MRNPEAQFDQAKDDFLRTLSRNRKVRLQPWCEAVYLKYGYQSWHGLCQAMRRVVTSDPGRRFSIYRGCAYVGKPENVEQLEAPPAPPVRLSDEFALRLAEKMEKLGKPTAKQPDLEDKACILMSGSLLRELVDLRRTVGKQVPYGS